MDKGAIKTFAIEARKILMKSAATQAGFYGVTKDGCTDPIQKGAGFEVYRTIAGTENRIYGNDINRRRKLKEAVESQGFDQVIEETAYTWFNRLIAIRFMEVNGYLPTRTRVLSSETGSNTPDLVAQYLDVDLGMSDEEIEKVAGSIKDNRYDDAFALLFVKQCNALNELLPKLFEKTDDYMELLLKLSYTNDGVVRMLVDSIPESNFNVEEEGQVEIIGWLYQYYNDEPKRQVISISKSIIAKEDIPAATQLFTTDWVVKYIVDNSLGRYWLENNPDSTLKDKLLYFAPNKKNVCFNRSRDIVPESIKILDPAMGSGHFLVYAFDVMMEIYRECGYSDRDSAKSIIENNLYGLEIDKRAQQLAYFALMMKGCQYNRRFLRNGIQPNTYTIIASNDIDKATIDYFTNGNVELEKSINSIISDCKNADNFGSIISVKNVDFSAIYDRFTEIENDINVFSYSALSFLRPIVKIAEVMADKYDIVVTNPPYLNKYNNELKAYINEHYKDYSGDLFSVFMYHNFFYCKDRGYVGFMTPFVWMFIKSYEKLRLYLLKNKSFTTLVQMEYSAFEEATVPICSFVIKNEFANAETKGIYFRLCDFVGGMKVQGDKVLEAISNTNCGYLYETNQHDYEVVPGTPIAYWLSHIGLAGYKNGLISRYVTTKQGFKTGDNNRFLRLWYEVDFDKVYLGSSRSNKKWFPCNKGGDYRKWYGNLDYTVNWENEGFELINHRDEKGKQLSRPQNLSFNFKEALTWSTISSGPVSFRYSSPNMMFESKGSECFPISTVSIYDIAGYLNSAVAMYYFKALAPTLDYSEGAVLKLPYLKTKSTEVEQLVRENIELAKQDWDSFETAWDFERHPLLPTAPINSGVLLFELFDSWEADCEYRFQTLKKNEEKINSIFISEFGLQDEIEPEVSYNDVTVRLADRQREVKSLISYAVGCMFGRYSLDKTGIAYAGGSWDECLYNIYVPDSDNCIPITDEAYFEDDIVGRFCDFIRIVYGEEVLEQNLDFIANAIGGKGGTSREIIRNYFLNDFFKDHSNAYSVTGSGKRPIYWLFDSGKQNGFKCLIYMHRYDKDTVGRVRSDYLRKAQDAIESALKNAEYAIANSTSAVDKAAATKKREKYIKQLNETRIYFQALSHVALQRIEIDLDDGVKTNYAKFQGIEIVDENGKKQKIDLLAKI